MKEAKSKSLRCCICGKKIAYGESENADPVCPNRRCCRECADNVVLPARLGATSPEATALVKSALTEAREVVKALRARRRSA